jgi:hypothetical protein
MKLNCENRIGRNNYAKPQYRNRSWALIAPSLHAYEPQAFTSTAPKLSSQSQGLITYPHGTYCTNPNDWNWPWTVTETIWKQRETPTPLCVTYLKCWNSHTKAITYCGWGWLSFELEGFEDEHGVQVYSYTMSLHKYIKFCCWGGKK